jgi:2-C-methyl-D-erythritol 4-phosphate cytidylyltransferase
MERSVIIVAGGSGRRMNADVPKQFMLLDDEPILLHSIRTFHSFDPMMELVLVLPEEHHKAWRELLAEHVIHVPHQVVAGGAERFHSVKAGAARIGSKGIVAVHDGVRPLVSADLIARCFAAAEEHGTAIPVVPVNSSMRQVNGEASQAVDRNGFRLVQTPQCFHVPLLKKALEMPYDPAFTDEATLVERSGTKIHLVDGEERNIKITTPFDMKMARALLES